MVPFAFIFAPLLLVATVGRASPHQPRSHSPRVDSCGTFVETPIGIAQGTVPVDGISQFAVKYASAQRWQNPVVEPIWWPPYASPTQ